MKQTIFNKTRTTRNLSRRQPTADGRGWTSVLDGQEEIFYRTEIDLDLLHLMAQDAAKNKSQRSRDGALTVYVIERNRLT